MRVFRRPLILRAHGSGKVHEYNRLIMPKHCGRYLLLAGEPKRDIHNLFGEGGDTMIDPFDNLPTSNRQARRFKIKEFIAAKEKDPTYG